MTTHFHLMPRFRIGGAVTVLLLRAFMTVKGKFLLFTFPAKYEESHFITTEVS